MLLQGLLYIVTCKESGLLSFTHNTTQHKSYMNLAITYIYVV